MGLTSSNIPAGNPHSERGQRNHHSFDTPSVHPPFLQCAQRNVTTRRLHTNLIGEQHLPPDQFLPGPYSRPHNCNSQPLRADRLVPATHPSFLSGTGKRAESYESPGTAPHGLGIYPQGGSGRDPVSTCPRGSQNPGAPPHQPKLCTADQGITS